MKADNPPGKRFVVLWILLGLFCLRVLGQILVAFFNVHFLPPMEEWYSGVIAYPWLLLYQFVIIFVCGKVCIDFTRRQGLFAIPRRILGSPLLIFGAMYFGVMVIRYVIRMSLYAPERWAGGSIPIFSHWVLASFVLLVGSYHWQGTRYKGQVRAARSATRRLHLQLLVRAVTTTFIVGCLASWALYQLAPSILAHTLSFQPPKFAVRVEGGVSMMTSDGVALVSKVYHPQRVNSSPTILVRMPLPWTVGNRFSADLVGRMWAEHGYTVVIQQTRGSYPSGGQHHPFRNERRDGIETLNWIAEQPWFDGRIGMWGGSYFGYTQWVLADQVDPGPSAVFIQVCSTNWYRMFYPGGAFSLESALYWAVWIDGGYSERPSRELLQPGYQGFPLIEADDRIGRDVSFFNDWALHRDRDRYWAQIDGEKRPESLVAPALLMAGWYDPFLPTTLDDFVRIREGAKPDVAAATCLIVGPWAHARAVTFPDGSRPRNYRLESLAPSLPWYDRHLKAVTTSDNRRTSPVRIFVMGKNIWRDEEDWPLSRTRYTPYYMRSAGNANSATGDGTLSLIPPRSGEPADRYVYDPRDPVPTAGGAMFGPRAGIALQDAVEKRPDVLVYSTPPLEEDLEVTGSIMLILYVSTTGPSTDFTGKLVDVHPDGSAYNVSDGIFRLNHGDPNNTIGSDQPIKIQIDLWPTSMVFLKGHCIRLEVSSSNYPRFDRNPNTGENIATETHPITVTQMIHHRPDTPSRLILPVIPPRADR